MIDTLAIETGIEPEYEKRLIASARKRGWSVVEVQHVPFSDYFITPDAHRTDGLLPLSLIDNPNVWFHGDINGTKIAQATTCWQVHAPWDQLDLQRFSHYAWDLLLNEQHYLTMSEFYQNPHRWFELFESKDLFIKSTAADKTLSGIVIQKENFETQWQQATFYEPPWDTVVAVAPPLNIKAEARFLVVAGVLVTGSYYRTGGQRLQLRIESGPVWDEAVAALINLQIRGYDPAPSWVLDLAEGPDGWKIIEVGATSCCGLYACDTDKFVEALDGLCN